LQRIITLGLLALLVGTTLVTARPTPAGATVLFPAISVGANVNLSQAVGNQFEGSVAVDPSNPNRIFVLGRDETGFLVGARTTDGGTTWTHARMGTSVASADHLPPAWGNTSVTFDSYGNLFVVYLSTSVHTYTDFGMSTDGGATFTNTQALAQLTDQPVVAAGHGSVWVTYNQGGVNLAQGASDTGPGVIGTFGVAEAMPGANGGAFGDLTVGPQGQVVAAFGNRAGAGPVTLSVDPDGLGPLGFQGAVTVTTTNVGGFDYIPAAPNWGVDAEAHLAWDQSGGPHNGRLYLAYLDAPAIDLASTMLYVMHSDDGGATWSTPVLVNDDGTKASHFMPGFAVDQSTGTVGATWYDTRGDPTRVNARYYGSVSADGGDTWSPNFPIAAGTSNATLAPPPGPIRNTNWGDYTGLAFQGGVMVPVWADNSNSTGNNPAGANASFDLYTARVTLTALPQAPTVTASPVPTSVPAGAAYAFSASASGTPAPTVQWQRSNDSGATWGDLTGATSGTYSAAATVADDGAQFRAVFTNSSGTATTSAATLSVTMAPVIISSPISQTINVGTVYTFMAVAYGLPYPTAQWQRSSDAGLTWSDIPGATAYTYPITAALGDDGAQFRAVFTNSSGTATTTGATLHVTTTTSLSFKVAHTTLKGGKRDILTVSVSSPVTGKGKVTGGTVAFYDGTSLVASVPVAKGKAKTVVTLAKGSHPLRAVYSGSGAVLAAQSPVVTVTAT
jgi:hypothetical protein